MKLYKAITVDLYNPYPLPITNAQQHNVGRGTLITLTANGQVVGLNEETVRIFARRPDGNVSYLDCAITEDGKIQADFTDQMLAVEGSIQVELEFTTTETNITTPIFIVEVNKSNVKEGVVSSNEYKALEEYTAEAKKAANQAKEVYDNIPNYEARLSELEVYKANSITSKHSGTTVVVTDSANVPPKSIKTLFGKSIQNGIPSKDNGVDVVSLGESGSIVVDMFGGNLIPPTTYAGKTVNGVTFDVLDDGWVHVYGTATEKATFDYLGSWGSKTGITLPKNFIVGMVGDKSIGLCVYGYDKDGKYTYLGTGKTNQEYKDIHVYFEVNQGKTVDTTIRPYVCTVQGLTDYAIPQSFTFQTPNGLNGIPLGASIPTEIRNSPIHLSGLYWDEIEQQYYIGDTKNENGKDIQRIGVYTLTGNEYIEKGENDYGIMMSSVNALMNKVLFTHGTHGTEFRLSATKFNWMIWYDKEGAFATIDEFKSFIAGKTLYYILTEPIITDTTEQYDIVMNYPSTTIINDAEAHMEVEYVADTKNYIDNLEKKHDEDIQTLKTAIIALGGTV